MMFFPYESYKIATNLSIEEIQKKFKSEIEVKDPIALFPISKLEYEGFLEERNFKINKTSGRRPSIISGKIIDGDGGNIIQIKIRMDLTSLMFLIVWQFSLLVILIIFLSNKPYKENFMSQFWGIILMMFFGYTFFTMTFKLENYSSKKFLLNLFDGTEIT